MEIKTFKELFLNMLSEIYDVEEKLAGILPIMASRTGNKALAELFRNHHDETKRQRERLDKIFSTLGEERVHEPCEAIANIVLEAESYMEDIKNKRVLDAALITAAQKMEHYEIATYGSLCALAQELGYSQVAALLHQSLEEEKATDKSLTMIAQESVNSEAHKMAA